MTGEPVVVSGPVSPVDRLDLAAVEADLETPFVSALLNGASTGDGPTVRTVRAVPALVAEVKRLREHVEHWRQVAARYEADRALAHACRRKAVAELAAAQAAVDRVRALHAERPNDWWSDGDRVTDRWKPTECALCICPWPCPTIRTLDGAT